MTLRHGIVDVRDHILSVRNIALELGNDGASLHDVATHVRNGFGHTSRRRRQ